jgi:hypothetical protein
MYDYRPVTIRIGSAKLVWFVHYYCKVSSSNPSPSQRGSTFSSFRGRTIIGMRVLLLPLFVPSAASVPVLLLPVMPVQVIQFIADTRQRVVDKCSSSSSNSSHGYWIALVFTLGLGIGLDWISAKSTLTL